MYHSSLTVALITEVFADDHGGARLIDRLTAARSAGAELAVLPELPMDRWVPGSKERDPNDAELPLGPRHEAQAEAARKAGIALIGGAIVRDPATGTRHNTALVFDDTGALLLAYRKVHLPYEPGFWEAAQYEPGTEPPTVVPGFALPFGIQICSDANRPSGCQLLAAQGAGAIFVPRATPAASWDRWRLVLRGDAVTSACWVVTVNRPPVGDPSPIGGPSAAIAPDGRISCETTESMAVVKLDGEAVARARDAYPGYLDFHPDVHSKGWIGVANRSPATPRGMEED